MAEDLHNMIKLIARRILQNDLNQSDLSRLKNWLEESESNRSLFNDVMDKEWRAKQFAEMDQIDTVQAWNSLGVRLIAEKLARARRNRLVVSAAIILIIIAMPIFFFMHRPARQTELAKAAAPAHDTTMQKKGPGKQLLPDGSHVWLRDSSSYVLYPISFTGKERLVEFGGEVYFEIAHDPSRPFKAIANSIQIEVLGTEFDASVWPGKEANIDVIHGSVMVRSKEMREQVIAGQQARISANKIVVSKKMDTTDAGSWRNRYYIFDKTALPTVMKKVSDWYGMPFRYEDNPEGTPISGPVERNIKIDSALRVLERMENGYAFFRIKMGSIVVSRYKK